MASTSNGAPQLLRSLVSTYLRESSIVNHLPTVLSFLSDHRLLSKVFLLSKGDQSEESAVVKEAKAALRAWNGAIQELIHTGMSLLWVKCNGVAISFRLLTLRERACPVCSLSVAKRDDSRNYV